MKRLVVCSDGTWNTMEKGDGRGEDAVTNVVKMARAIAPSSPQGVPQVVLYDEGVGTGLGPLDRFLGGALGLGLKRNVEDAYRFLVNNHEEGDEVWLFGFSRGAYTIRSVAGMVRKCGILRKEEAHRVPQAFDLYRDDRGPDSDAAKAFRAEHAKTVPIHFLGVWDTVGRLGVPGGFWRVFASRNRRFHDPRLSRIVEHAYHAVAIDERRRPYEPTMWTKKDEDVWPAGHKVEQVWFAGVHSGVGGGYDPCGLSDVAFLWMKEKAEAAGLAFDESYVKTRIQPDPGAPWVESRTGFWKLLPKAKREIGAAWPETESVHPSALARMGNPACGYAPANLREYLARQGKP